MGDFLFGAAMMFAALSFWAVTSSDYAREACAEIANTATCERQWVPIYEESE